MSFVDLSIPASGRPSIASELRKDYTESKDPRFAHDINYADVPENHVYAEGGPKAWITVAGAACVIFVTFGYLASFGIYVTYYLQVLLRDRTADEIAWIGSLQMFFLFGGAIFGGSLGDKWGVGIVLWPSAMLLSLAVLLTSLCTEYWHFILCQGVFTGLMMGFAYAPAMAAVGQHFYRRRPFAMALSLAGGGLGGLLYPIILNCLLHETTLGFAWTQRVIGFTILGLSIIGCALVRPGAVKEPGRKLFLFSAFKNPAYSIQIAGLFFCVWGIFTPFFYLPTYGLQHRMQPELAFYLLAILNACSFVGRIAAGVAGNILGPFNILPFSAFVCSLLILCWIAMTSQASIITMAVLYGLFEGGIVALLFATLSHIAPRAQDIGTYIGQASSVVAFAGLTGTPINGAMIDRYHSFTPSRIFSGVSILVGGTLVLISWYGFGRKQSLARVRAAEGIERVEHENASMQGEKGASRLG